jgi:hypothetical protein
MTACTQPGCTGTIVDGYCDVCGSPAGAVPFVPAEAAASAASAPADAPGLAAVGWGTGGSSPDPKDERINTPCVEPGCTGTIVDGYCDVCGSPAGAVPIVPAEVTASAQSSAPADRGDVDAEEVHGEKQLAEDEPDDAKDYRTRVEEAELPDDVRKAALSEVGELERTNDQSPESSEIQTWLDTVLDLPWSAETTDSIDIQAAREVGPAAADTEKVEIAKVDAEKVEPEKADTAAAGRHDDDPVELPAVLAAHGGGGQPRPQLPEQQVLGPVVAQNPGEKRRFGSLVVAATVFAALLIGAFLFGMSRDRGGTARSVSTVTTATVSASASESSDEPTPTGREESTIQLEDLPDTARPFEAVRIQGTYDGGADTFLRVERWEGGKWLAFPVPTKTDQSGRFTAHVEFGQPGRYRLRVRDPDSGVTSKPFVLVIEA